MRDGEIKLMFGMSFLLIGLNYFGTSLEILGKFCFILSGVLLVSVIVNDLKERGRK